jgi:hypothetical protein
MHRRSQREEAAGGSGERSATGSSLVPKQPGTVVPTEVLTNSSGLSHTELARRVKDTAQIWGALCHTERHHGPALAGRRSPAPPVPEILADVFSARFGYRVTPYDMRLGKRGAADRALICNASFAVSLRLRGGQPHHHHLHPGQPLLDLPARSPGSARRRTDRPRRAAPPRGRTPIARARIRPAGRRPLHRHPPAPGAKLIVETT